MFLGTHDHRRKWKPVAPLPIVPIKTNLKAAQMAERYAALFSVDRQDDSFDLVTLSEAA